MKKSAAFHFSAALQEGPLHHRRGSWLAQQLLANGTTSKLQLRIELQLHA
jgi:hypothetical protein